MALMSNTDNLLNKPKFPLERTVRGPLVKLSLNGNVVAAQNHLTFVGTGVGGVANGWVANSTNIGTPNSGLQGWNENGPTVVNVSGNTIYMSVGTAGIIPTGNVITFSKPITGLVGTQNVYNSNTYLVTSGRMSNANGITQSTTFKTSTIKQSTIAHQGWVVVNPGTGYVKSIQVLNAGNQASNGYLVFTANSTFPGNFGGGAGANASYTVNANGAIVSVTLLNSGANYFLTPIVKAPFTGIAANAVNATFVITMGGRANRVQTEVLAVLNNPIATDPNSGGQWFAGV